MRLSVTQPHVSKQPRHFQSVVPKPHKRMGKVAHYCSFSRGQFLNTSCHLTCMHVAARLTWQCQSTTLLLRRIGTPVRLLARVRPIALESVVLRVWLCVRVWKCRRMQCKEGCVLPCRGDYTGDTKVREFLFPREENARIRALGLPQENLFVTANSGVSLFAFPCSLI